jgi:hypothetical protein
VLAADERHCGGRCASRRPPCPELVRVYQAEEPKEVAELQAA